MDYNKIGITCSQFKNATGAIWGILYKEEIAAKISGLMEDRAKGAMVVDTVHPSCYKTFLSALAAGQSFEDLMKWFGDGHGFDVADELVPIIHTINY